MLLQLNCEHAMKVIAGQKGTLEAYALTAAASFELPA
jgi:hypothetical protein